MKAPILAALVVLSALVAPAAAIQNTTNDKLVVQESEQRQDTDGNVEFGSGLFTVTNGNVAELEIEFTDTSEATVIIGDENEVNYKLVTTVTDENGDGTATLLFDTTKLHTTEQTVKLADEGDGLIIENELRINKALDSGDYPLAIEKDGELEHLSTLNVISLEASLAEESKELAPEPNQLIEFDTRLDPGRTVNVRVQSSSDADNPMVESREVTVQENGTVAAQFDFDGFESETELTVTLLHNGQRVEESAVVRGESSTPGQPGFGFLSGAVAVLTALLWRRQ